MFRLIPKLKGFRPWANKLLAQSQVCIEQKFAVLPRVPPTMPVSQFVKDTKPEPIPVLRQEIVKDTETKWTTAEYLEGDPHRLDALVPDEINLHRLAVTELMGHDNNRRLGNTHVLVLGGAHAVHGHPVRQHSEFLYLCDCLLPGVVLILVRNRKKELNTVLFQPCSEDSLDPMLANIACKRYNVDEVLSISQLRQTLYKKLHHASVKLWHTLDSGPLSQLVKDLATQLNLQIHCPQQILQSVRSVKSQRELGAIRRANSIAAKSLQELMSEHKAQLGESHLSALFAHKCRQRFAHQPLPYEPKLAAGLGGMRLMDVSCQYGGYCGSLARSWPIFGRFTPPQKVIYGMLLELRSKICGLISKSNYRARTPRELHAAYLVQLAEQLRELRVLPLNVRSSEEVYRAVGKFSCFSTLIKHVGLDLMESSNELLNSPLRPGNVISLQMSICIPHDCQQAYPEFRGVLCILADTILIKNKFELEVLTNECVVKGRDVENLCNELKRQNPQSVAN